MKFIVEGTYRNDHETRNFVRQVEGDNETQARESIYTLLGSEQNLKRSRINFTKVEKL